MGAEVNHLWPTSVYSPPGPPPSTGVARVVLARTSEPPCFSVMDMPIVAPVFSVTGMSRESYDADVSGATHCSARSGWFCSAGTHANVMLMGHDTPGSACAQPRGVSVAVVPGGTGARRCDGRHLVLEVAQRRANDMGSLLPLVAPRERRDLSRQRGTGGIGQCVRERAWWRASTRRIATAHLVVDAERHEVVVRGVELHLGHMVPELVVRPQHRAVPLRLAQARHSGIVGVRQAVTPEIDRKRDTHHIRQVAHVVRTNTSSELC